MSREPKTKQHDPPHDVVKNPCPACGHEKRKHNPTFIDGVALPPYFCKVCGEKCHW